MNCALLQETLQAFKFTLDPTPAQEADLSRHAGAARWAFNWALARKIAAHREWRTQVDTLVDSGLDERDARKKASTSIRIPGQATIKKHLNQIKGDSRHDDEHPDGFHGPFLPCPWWHEVSTYAFQSAFYDADAAFKNWFDSLTDRRAGRAVGYPRFKKKGKARDSFRLHHDVKKPTIRPDGYRRLIMPRLGSVRIHDSAKRLTRLITKGQAVVQSVTVSRGGNRWYASVLVKVTRDIPDKPTRAQTDRGTVGVDWGISHLATLSQPLNPADPADPASVHVDNPRHLNAATRQLTKAQRTLSRTQRGSNRRTRAARRVGVIQHHIAQRRATTIHQLTKQLATRFATVAIEDLNVTGMSASAKGTIEKPGRRVRQKAGLNRAVLDASPGELRRQLTYKTSWYGSSLAVTDRWHPSSKTCSACGTVKPTLSLAEREYHCTTCGLTIDRDLNAARNIARHAVPLVEGDVKARRSPVSPAPEGRHGRAERQTREGPPPGGGSPRRE